MDEDDGRGSLRTLRVAGVIPVGLELHEVQAGGNAASVNHDRSR